MGHIIKKINYTPEMGAKPVFSGLLGAFRFEELLLLTLFTVKLYVFVMELGNVLVQCSDDLTDSLLNANSNFQFEFARACCQVLIFILPNKMR